MLERLLTVKLRPLQASLGKVMDLISTKDTNEIFSEPVDLEEVPDYTTVVKEPMDLSTMRIKLESGQYADLTLMERDFDLMITNCLNYNNRDTVFYRAAIKMRDQCGVIFRQARAELEAAGLLRKPPIEEETLAVDIDRDLAALQTEKKANADTITQLESLMVKSQALKHGMQRAKRVKLIRSEIGKVRKQMTSAAATGGTTTNVSAATDSCPSDVDAEMPLAQNGQQQSGSTSTVTEASSTSTSSVVAVVAADNSSGSTGGNVSSSGGSPTGGVNRRTAVLFTRKAQASSSQSPTKKSSPAADAASSPVVAPKKGSRGGGKRLGSNAEAAASSPGVAVAAPTTDTTTTTSSPTSAIAAQSTTTITRTNTPHNTTELSTAKSASTTLPESAVAVSDVIRQAVVKQPESFTVYRAANTGPGHITSDDDDCWDSVLGLGRRRRRRARHGDEDAAEGSDLLTDDDSEDMSSCCSHSISDDDEEDDDDDDDSDEGDTMDTCSGDDDNDRKKDARSTATSTSTSSKGARNKPSTSTKRGDTAINRSVVEPATASTASGTAPAGGGGRGSGRVGRKPKGGTRAGVAGASNSSGVGRPRRGGGGSAGDAATTSALSSLLLEPMAPLRPEDLQPLQLVWAKCRGYPWYPALIIDPKMPKDYVHCGVPLPLPPADVMALGANHTQPVYLILFFDTKRTWQWLPAEKLELMGNDPERDIAKANESRKPTDRKAVNRAYQNALKYIQQISDAKNDDVDMKSP